MTVYSFLQKNQKAFFRGALFAVVFFSSLLLSQKPVAAQNVFYPEFECLFTSSTTTPCDHSASNIDIKSGTKSGIVYGKIPSGTEYIDTTGVKAVTMILGLAMDISKINTMGTNDPEYSNRNNYFWSRVADDPDDTFVVRLGYTKPGTTTPTYKLQTISAKKESVSFSTPLGIPASVTLALKLPFTINTTKNTVGQQEKIAFFTKGGDHAINSQVVQVVMDSPGNVSIPYGSTMTADLWYCAGLQDYAPNHDGRYTPRTPTTIPGDQRVEYFTTDGVYTYKDGNGNAVKATDGYKYDEEKCGGTAHYKIGNTVTFSLPKDVTAAQSDQTTTIDTGIKASENISPEDNLPSCGLVNGTVVGCIAQGVYYLIFNPIQWVAGIIGRAFDFFLGYSISDESYRAEVIVTGWKLVRDISNIFFILILVWTGLSTVFGFSKVSMRSIVPQLIINALLINFSLFGARVVIDISNVTARLFYNTMSVCQGTCDYKIDDATGKKILKNPNTETTAGFKPLSAKIVSAFDPQKIFNPNILSPDNTSNTATNTQQGSANLQRGASSDLTSTEYAGYFLIVTLIAAFIMFGIAKMFFGVMFMFVGRVVGLYMVMIFAPFAIMTRGGMPLVGDMKEIGWKDWSSDLVKYSVLAPVFVFFLYIIYSFINSDFVQAMNLGKEAGFMGTVLGIVIPMFIIYMLVQQGVKIAQKYAGKAGEVFQNIGKTATGLVGGLALGGTALMGGRVVGAAAKKLDESRFGVGIRNIAARSGIVGKIGQKLQEGVTATRSGSFDVRQTLLGKTVSKEFGVDFNKKGLNALAGAGLGLGTDQRKGGFEADVKRRQAEQEAKTKLLEEKMSDDKIKEYNQRQQDKRSDKIEALLEKALIEKHGKVDVEDWKKNNKQKYNNEKAEVLKDPGVQTKIATIPPAKELRSVADMNKDRRKQFADNLKKPGVDGLLNKVPIIGAALGANVRITADQAAAKKIGENSKVEKELAEIETTLKKGFQDLIAMDMFQGSPSFAALDPIERSEIIKYGSIQTDLGNNRKGKGMYDVLDTIEKAAVDTDAQQKKEALTRGTKDEKDKAKEVYDEMEDMVKAREANKYDLKDLRDELKKAKSAWVANPADQDLRDNFRQALKDIKIAEKHQDKWKDISAYMKTRRDKLKGEEKK